jgi:hypothetical protein
MYSITACNQQKTNQSVQSNGNISAKNEFVKTYQFDTTATVSGCADVLLQKISKDLKYELLVELKLDGIQKRKEIEISEYLNYVTITFKEYPSDNEDISKICDDVVYREKMPKTPIDYYATSGNLIITRYPDKDNIISAVLKNMTVKNKKGEVVNLPFEKFTDLGVHWLGG